MINQNISSRLPEYVVYSDVIIYINKSSKVTVCDKCEGKVDIMRNVQSVSVSSQLHGGSSSSTSTANITFTIPETEKHLYFDMYNIFCIKEIDEIEIYMRGTILSDKYYYRVFWGIVAGINVSYRHGIYNVSVNCVDMLYWLHVANVNLNPAAIFSEGALCDYIKPYTSWFADRTVAEIITQMFSYSQTDLKNTTTSTALQDGSIPAALTIPKVYDMIGEGMFNVNSLGALQNDVASLNKQLEATTSIWGKRLDEIKNLLCIFGAGGCGWRTGY